MAEKKTTGPLLVTGATGYIGGRLVPRLLEQGYRVRCLVRTPAKLQHHPWAAAHSVEIVKGDLADSTSTQAAMDGCAAAYYLVHSMLAAGRDYARVDRELAEHFASLAAESGIRRLIYLAGLGETGIGLSEHLASRRQVEEALASGPVPLTVFRAAMIIGSGSASFEILRYLVERLPVMVTPRWVSTRSQPIAVRNVMHYLVRCLEEPKTVGRTLDIGGADILTYREIMEIMAEALGLGRRLIIPVPVLTPRLSSLWIHLVTPISHRIARPLAEGLRNPVVCRDDEAARMLPQRLLTVRQAIDAALGKVAEHEVETSWSDAGVMPGDPDWAGGTVYSDRRAIEIAASPDTVFSTISRIGGEQGYFAVNWLWRLRGILDHLIGGPGLRRGRRDPLTVTYGDALDFWRVTGLQPGRLLELRAEMRLPGQATLTFEVKPKDGSPSAAMLHQTARFKPRGLLGLLYWYLILPFHHIVFQRMLRGIRRHAERV